MAQLNKDILSTEELITEDISIYINEHVNSSVQELFKEYLEMRAEMKMPLSMRGIKALTNRLEDLSSGNVQIQRLMLSNATQNQWKNIFRPSDQEIEAASKALVESLRSLYGI